MSSKEFQTVDPHYKALADKVLEEMGMKNPELALKHLNERTFRIRRVESATSPRQQVGWGPNIG